MGRIYIITGDGGATIRMMRIGAPVHDGMLTLRLSEPEPNTPNVTLTGFGYVQYISEDMWEHKEYLPFKILKEIDVSDEIQFNVISKDSQ